MLRRMLLALSTVTGWLRLIRAKHAFFGALLFALLAVSPARAASVSIVAQLNPGQSGPLYGWSLLLSTAAGAPVGAVNLILTGFDSFDFQNPDISLPDSIFEPIGDEFTPPDGRFFLVLNAAPGQVIAPGGTSNVLLGTLFGPFNDVGQIKIEPCDVCGGTVFGPPPDYLPNESFTITAVPEPGAATLASDGFALVALGMARRRRNA